MGGCRIGIGFDERARSAFYLKSVAPKDMSLAEIFRALVPFILIQIVALALILFFPQIALWLPTWMNG